MQVIVLARFLNEVTRYALLTLKLRPAPLSPAEESEEKDSTPAAAKTSKKQVRSDALDRLACIMSVHMASSLESCRRAW